MIIGLICSCHNSTSVIRNFLSSHGHPDPFSVKLYKGEEAKAWVNKNNISDIQNYLAMHSSFAILVGWGENKQIHWADINSNYLPERIKGEAIVERFA